MVSESARHALYARLEEVLGGEHARTLMASLPTYPLTEVATKSDVARLEERMERLEERMDRFGERLDELNRTLITATVGAMTALTAIFSLVVTVFSR